MPIPWFNHSLMTARVVAASTVLFFVSIVTAHPDHGSSIPTEEVSSHVEPKSSDDYFVDLDKLPEGIKFPAPLCDHVFYDHENRILRYRGVMNQGIYDQLRQLSEDSEYKGAVDRLFKNATTAPPKATESRPLIVWLLGIAVIVLGFILIFRQGGKR